MAERKNLQRCLISFYNWYLLIFRSEFCQIGRWIQNFPRIPVGILTSILFITCQQTNRGPIVKGKTFDIVIMSNILPFKNGPEESFVKGKLFYIVIMSNTLPFKNGPEESFVKG